MNSALYVFTSSAKANAKLNHIFLFLFDSEASYSQWFLMNEITGLDLNIRLIS